ncbi:MAG: hypothetical protein ACJAZO_004213 [Myxococcota bacterium]|jgi:hypothetical protein
MSKGLHQERGNVVAAQQVMRKGNGCQTCLTRERPLPGQSCEPRQHAVLFVCQRCAPIPNQVEGTKTLKWLTKRWGYPGNFAFLFWAQLSAELSEENEFLVREVALSIRKGSEDLLILWPARVG